MRVSLRTSSPVLRFTAIVTDPEILSCDMPSMAMDAHFPEARDDSHALSHLKGMTILWDAALISTEEVVSRAN